VLAVGVKQVVSNASAHCLILKGVLVIVPSVFLDILLAIFTLLASVHPHVFGIIILNAVTQSVAKLASHKIKLIKQALDKRAKVFTLFLIACMGFVSKLA
jgi:hypothetical protein